MATLCEQCSSSGLPILPVRYTIVPNSVQPALPGWASGDQVKSVFPGMEYQYALRTLRSGYLYLFYAKNARGSNQWDCFSVGEDGCLTKQPSLIMALPQATPDFQCSRLGHTNTNVHYLVIEQPEKCGATWIAFSEHKWSYETINEYTSNSKLRNARMQTLHPAQMIDGAKHSHGNPVDAASLQGILEYNAALDPAQLPSSGVARTLSQDDGSYTSSFLEQRSTRYPWYLRNTDTQVNETAKSMHTRAVKKDGSPGTPHVLALWDAIGIAHELNGYRNDAAGRIDQYGKERALQIGAHQAIVGLETTLKDKRLQAVHHLQKQAKDSRQWYDAQGVKKMRINAQTLAEPERSRELQYCDDLDELGKLDANMSSQIKLTQNRRGYGYTPQQTAQYQTSRNTVLNEAREYAKNKPAIQQRADEYVQTEAWEKYLGKLNQGVRESFKNNWDQLLKAGDVLIDRRTQALVNWLEAPLFIHTLEDFHSTNTNDGILFEDAVSTAMFGIGSSQSGEKKIDEWVKEAKASIKTNLVWRVIAMNQQEGIEVVDEALKHAAAGVDVPLTAANWANVAKDIKWNKLADVVKKSQSFDNTNIRAANSGGAMKPANGLAFLKIFATLGDRLTIPWVAKRVDSVISEKVMQNLLLIRAGAHVDDVLALAHEQALRECEDRYAMLRRMQVAQAFSSVMEDEAGKLRPNAEVLKEKWAKLAQNADKAAADGRFNAAKDARLALVVAVLEAYNLGKSGYDAGVKRDAKSMVVLASGVASFSAAAVDVYTNVVKGALEESSMTFQRLKFFGGVLGGAASLGGVASAIFDAKRFKDEGNVFLYRLAIANATATAFGGASNALAALTYCGPWLTEVAERQAAKRAAITAATRLAAAAATRLALYRAVLMGAGLGLNLVALGVQGAIWYFSDNELQAWCERCAMGSKPDKSWTVDKQGEELFKATYAVGI